jgi:hypothetical protein
MDDDVYERLKKEVPPRKLSAFITEAVRAKLQPESKSLDAAYRAARKERWRAGLEEIGNTSTPKDDLTIKYSRGEHRGAVQEFKADQAVRTRRRGGCPSSNRKFFVCD